MKKIDKIFDKYQSITKSIYAPADFENKLQNILKAKSQNKTNKRVLIRALQYSITIAACILILIAMVFLIPHKKDITTSNSIPKQVIYTPYSTTTHTTDAVLQTTQNNLSQTIVASPTTEVNPTTEPQQNLVFNGIIYGYDNNGLFYGAFIIDDSKYLYINNKPFKPNFTPRPGQHVTIEIKPNFTLEGKGIWDAEIISMTLNKPEIPFVNITTVGGYDLITPKPAGGYNHIVKNVTIDSTSDFNQFYQSNKDTFNLTSNDKFKELLNNKYNSEYFKDNFVVILSYVSPSYYHHVIAGITNNQIEVIYRKTSEGPSTLKSGQIFIELKRSEYLLQNFNINELN